MIKIIPRGISEDWLRFTRMDEKSKKHAEWTKEAVTLTRSTIYFVGRVRLQNLLEPLTSDLVYFGFQVT
jgi:hypothetical protein